MSAYCNFKMATFFNCLLAHAEFQLRASTEYPTSIDNIQQLPEDIQFPLAIT